MLTKKHFEYLARRVAVQEHYYTNPSFRDEVLALCTRFGPNFDSARFLAKVKKHLQEMEK
jgi:hypothetical protein